MQASQESRAFSTLDHNQVLIRGREVTVVCQDSALRAEVIEKIRHACEKWGFFQVVNHGIPVNVLDGVIRGMREFNEQDSELKIERASSADWRDTLACSLVPNPPKPEELPSVCRDTVKDLGLTLFEILSEALGLNPNHLKDMNCAEGILLIGNYYPAWPEPELTFGIGKHTDFTFVTILLQDEVGGLEALQSDMDVMLQTMER
ncbi:deacetoxyvindoline 4-hydroxylase-like [Rosa rugosa]|uniref:deacetoxyvindoline 4-hydroxylase-like n=1 Tax=Rosa rugosa TaxID=74645 RepID=UPI002B400D15|nr:deacetoxyvindoline 4-hydroxylase-like [Rosa rugosa]